MSITHEYVLLAKDNFDDFQRLYVTAKQPTTEGERNTVGVYDIKTIGVNFDTGDRVSLRAILSMEEFKMLGEARAHRKREAFPNELREHESK